MNQQAKAWNLDPFVLAKLHGVRNGPVKIEQGSHGQWVRAVLSCVVRKDESAKRR